MLILQPVHSYLKMLKSISIGILIRIGDLCMLKVFLMDLQIKTLINYWTAYCPRLSIAWMLLSSVVGVLVFGILVWKHSETKMVGKHKKKISVAYDFFGAVSALYTVMLLGMLIADRNSGNRKINLLPFWSYRAYLAGNLDLLYMILFNILLFVPLGFFLAICLSGHFANGKAFRITILIGFVTSVLVEALQYLLLRGLSEFDDVFHNTLGSVVGAAVGLGLIGIWRYCKLCKGR